MGIDQFVLTVIFDSQLALKEQVNKLCQLAYWEIRRIGSIRYCLSFEATKISFPFLFFLGAGPEYCNTLLADSDSP